MYAKCMAHARRKKEESKVPFDRELETSTKYFRGYTIIVRGQIPEDIVERISKAHSAALRRHGRKQNSSGDNAKTN